MGVRPGAEFRVALEEAKKMNVDVILGDRISDITWHRAMSRITLTDIAKVIPHAIRFAQELTRLPTLDAMRRYLSETLPSPTSAIGPFSFPIPSIYPVLVTEKDLYLASVLRECRGRTIVAVVGAGHVPGITKHLHDREDGYLLRAELSMTPPLSRSPLAQQAALVGGAVVAGTAVVAAAMARGLNRNRTTGSRSRGTLPITLLLLGLEVTAMATWLSKEWLKMHVAITHVVQEFRDNQDAATAPAAGVHVWTGSTTDTHAATPSSIPSSVVTPSSTATK